MRPLGRRVPTDWDHISKYRLVRAEAPERLLAEQGEAVVLVP